MVTVRKVDELVSTALGICEDSRGIWICCFVGSIAWFRFRLDTFETVGFAFDIMAVVEGNSPSSFAESISGVGPLIRPTNSPKIDHGMSI
jgi:hypothetical protein